MSYHRSWYPVLQKRLLQILLNKKWCLAEARDEILTQLKGFVLEIKQNHLKYSRHSSYVECNDISTRSIRSFDNLFFKFSVSLPLVTGELLQKTADVNSDFNS